jgi:hypothetical protein
MAQQAVEGVVEAVRYDPQGQVLLVRVYERNGTTFSDRVLLGRADLVARLKAKKRFFAGKRVLFMGGTFETTYPVRLAQTKDGEIITTGLTRATSVNDHLEGVPLF